MKKEILIENLDNLHTTPLGEVRIKRNLNRTEQDIVNWCKEQIRKENSKITRQGKNWYVEIEGNVITVNAYSYTIITAHKQKERRE